MIQIHTQPSRRQLAQFGAAWLIFFLALAAWWAWKSASMTLPVALALLAVLVPTLGAMIPGMLRLVYLAMAYATYPIGWVVSHLLLALLYYLILTPIGLAIRLCKPSFFPKRPDPKLASYWIAKQGRRDAKDYLKPY